MNNFDVKAFAVVVEKYCKWVEEPPDPTQDTDLALQHLLAVYALALKFPEHVQRPENASHRNFRPKGRRRIPNRFSSFPFRYYKEFFDPYDPSETPVTGDILDDFSDIYTPLRRGLELWEEGLETPALWHWQLHFRIHWSEHATSAIRALDRYIHPERGLEQ